MVIGVLQAALTAMIMLPLLRVFHLPGEPLWQCVRLCWIPENGLRFWSWCHSRLLR
jgi:hypothetical protein